MALDETKVNEAIKLLEDMRAGNDNVFNGTIRRRFLQTIIEAGVLDATLTDINHTTIIGAGGGSVQAAQKYDHRLRIEVNGQPYFIGLYNA